MPTARTSAHDIVRLRFDGSAEGPLAPSSEWRFHRDILARRPEVNAVVHAHPVYCTAFAMCRREIPAVHYMMAAFGGTNVRCAPYATFGTEALAADCVAALEGRRAALLANHGVVAFGAGLAAARALAEEVENLARQYLAFRAAGLAPVLLTAAEMDEVAAGFADYARPG